MFKLIVEETCSLFEVVGGFNQYFAFLLYVSDFKS